MADSEQLSPFEDVTGVLGDTRLFAAAISRKRAEQDAMLLQNRINLLRAEESKAQKKIEETKKRANEILDLRNRNEKKRMEREEFEASRAKYENDQRESIIKGRNDGKQKMNQIRFNLMNQRSENRNNIKDERREIMQRCKAEREGEYARAASKRDIIRTAAIALSNRRNKAMEDKEMTARRQFEDRIMQQESTRKNKEDLIMRMEQEEVELIQRLQQTQQRQRAAYDQLEDILQQPASGGGQSSGGAGTAGSSTLSGVAKNKAPNKPQGSSPKSNPAAGAKSTYTTVDGQTIEVGPEDDLDLHGVLSDK